MLTFQPKERKFQLFSCFYEASMIDKRSGERPIQFEMSIGTITYISSRLSILFLVRKFDFISFLLIVRELGRLTSDEMAGFCFA